MARDLYDAVRVVVIIAGVLAPRTMSVNFFRTLGLFLLFRSRATVII